MGLARVVTDGAAFAWLCDVYVEPAYRGQGLGKRLIRAVVEHPDLQGVTQWLLATRDAHGLYARFGFEPLDRPERWMRRRKGYIAATMQSSSLVSQLRRTARRGDRARPRVPARVCNRLRRGDPRCRRRRRVPRVAVPTGPTVRQSGLDPSVPFGEEGSPDAGRRTGKRAVAPRRGCARTLHARAVHPRVGLPLRHAERTLVSAVSDLPRPRQRGSPRAGPPACAAHGGAPPSRDWSCTAEARVGSPAGLGRAEAFDSGRAAAAGWQLPGSYRCSA